MNNLYKNGHYHWSLFIGHLVIEKLLKSIFVKKKNSTPVFSHDLLRIVDKIGDLKLTNEKKDIIDTISTFNIAARYDDYKRNFYNKCTKKYSSEWIKNIKEIRKWLKENYLK
jgi:HEPN domain-containing protein